MTDYYSSLNLDKNKKLDEINADLSRLESTWKRREITNPEKATTMLALIIQARKVFASDASRKTYDDELDRSQKQPEKTDPDKDRSAALNKWKKQAAEYYESGQYDLAKVAVEKALSLSSASVDDDALFALAADIYKENGNLDTAMTYINRAIVAAPNVSAYYLSKGLIYDHQASIAMQRGVYGNPANFRVEARKMFQLADVKAEQSGDLANRARACGALAFSYYFQDPIDKEEGEDFAILAVKFGGDSWGNADKVLKKVNALREEARQKEIEKEKARKESIYQEAKKIAESTDISALERAISVFEQITDYKDSTQQIENLVSRIQGIVDRAEKEKQDRIRKRKITIKLVIVAVPIIIISVVIGLIVRNNQQHKCGDNLRWTFEESTGTFSVSGTGEMYEYVPSNFSLKDEQRHRPWDDIEEEITHVVIGEGCTRIGSHAFYSLDNLLDVSIPDSVIQIGDSAFDFCEKLKSLELPSSLKSIEGSAFWGTGLESIYIPEYVDTLGSIADGAWCLEEIRVNKNNQYFTSIDGILFNKDESILWAYPIAKKGDIYSVPATVVEIRSVAFRGVDELVSISLPEKVTKIGWHAFEDCSSLRSINIPQTVTSLPEEVFGGCGFISFTIPDQISEIPYRAFAMCWDLESVYIPDGVTTIGNYSFSSCYNLIEIVIPLSVKSIGQKAFNDCKEDSVIYYSGTKEQWLSFAGSLDFDGVVECSDSSFRY